MASFRSTALMILALSHLSLADHYSQTCTGIRMAEDCHSLIVNCTAYDGRVEQSKLDLNHCFGNNDGHLEQSKDNQW
ncbi:hypothetical protein BDW71DRAFT_188654 [Aspergillus fruticulosus]